MTDKLDKSGSPTLGGVVRRAHRRMAWASVAMAGTLLLLAGVVALKIYIDSNLRLVARSLSYTVEAAVVFGDIEEIQKALNSMLQGEGIAFARVLDTKGQTLAVWRHEDPSIVAESGEWLGRQVMKRPAISAIHNDDQLVGHIELTGDGQGLLGFLLSAIAALLVCMAASAAMGTWLSRRMLNEIVTPLHSLAEVARSARYERNLGLRVKPTRILELRALGDNFNSLLAELQEQQIQLQKKNTVLAHEASHDSLTGLPNRAHFESRLISALEQGQKENTSFAVLFLDNDYFKQVNDTYGHSAGDALLVEVAGRIRSQLRESDLVARLGGDEFSALLTPIQNNNEATRIAEKIIKAMNSPLLLQSGKQLQPSLSIGIAIYPEHGKDMPALLRSADTAMYQAKAHRRGSQKLAIDQTI